MAAWFRLLGGLYSHDKDKDKVEESSHSRLAHPPVFAIFGLFLVLSVVGTAVYVICVCLK
ncbi:MAG: hypothetical protein WBV41_06200 [Terriglobales bacterium]